MLNNIQLSGHRYLSKYLKNTYHLSNVYDGYVDIGHSTLVTKAQYNIKMSE